MKEKKEKCRKLHAGKFFFGWFIGFIFTLLLLAGGLFWFYKSGSISSVESLFGFEISALNAEIKSTSIEKLISKVVNVANNYNDMTIEELADEVGLKLNNVFAVKGVGKNKTYEFKTIDLTSVVKGKVKDISDNVQKVVGDMSLQDIEQAFNVALPNIELINSVKISPIKDLQSAMTTAFETYTLNKISADFNVSFSNATMLETLLDTPINQLGSEIEKLKVKDVYDTTSADASKLIKALADKEIVKLSTEISSLQLNQILDIADNVFLEALSTSTLDTLNSDIKTLKVNQVFEVSGSKFLQALGDKYILDIDTEIDNILVTSIFDIPQSGVKGVWAYIDNVETLKLKDLDGAIDDIDFSQETLGSLQTNGLISASIDLSKTLKGSSDPRTLAEYTIQELISAISAV